MAAQETLSEIYHHRASYSQIVTFGDISGWDNEIVCVITVSEVGPLFRIHAEMVPTQQRSLVKMGQLVEVTGGQSRIRLIRLRLRGHGTGNMSKQFKNPS